MKTSPEQLRALLKVTLIPQKIRNKESRPPASPSFALFTGPHSCTVVRLANVQTHICYVICNQCRKKKQYCPNDKLDKPKGWAKVDQTASAIKQFKLSH